MKYYNYQVLNIDKIKFSEINLNDDVFNSLKKITMKLNLLIDFNQNKKKMNLLLFIEMKALTKLKISMKVIMIQLFLVLILKKS